MKKTFSEIVGLEYPPPKKTKKKNPSRQTKVLKKKPPKGGNAGKLLTGEAVDLNPQIGKGERKKVTPKSKWKEMKTTRAKLLDLLGGSKRRATGKRKCADLVDDFSSSMETEDKGGYTPVPENIKTGR